MSDREASNVAGGILTRACLLALFLPVSVLAAEALRNGGFESGDLSGWTPGGPPGYSATVVSSFSHRGEQLPKEGNFFVLLTSPVTTSSPTTTLTQTFHAGAGAVISGWGMFRCMGAWLSQGAPFYEVIIRGGSREKIVFSDDQCTSTNWVTWRYSVPADDDYIIVATVRYGGQVNRGNSLGLDGITVTAPADTKAPVVTPPKDIRVEIPAREKSAPATHPDISTFLKAATASDERDSAVVAKAVNPPAGFPVGETTVTFEAVDAAGNKGTATVRVTVVQAPATVAEPPVVVEAPKPPSPPPVPPPPVEPVPSVTPAPTVVKAPDGSVTWTFRGEIVEHEVDYHTFPANKDWLYVFEIGDGKNPAQWIRVEHPAHKYAPREDTSYADKTRRRFAWVPPETREDYRVQVWAEKGPYVLTVTGRADDHGNDWQHATPVALGKTVAGEIWEVPGNVDVFSFQGKKGGIYRIETQQSENPGGVLRVWDRQRDGGGTREDTRGSKPSRSVTFRTPRDDTYYVQVWGGAGRYTLKITRLK